MHCTESRLLWSVEILVFGRVFCHFFEADINFHSSQTSWERSPYVKDTWTLQKSGLFVIIQLVVPEDDYDLLSC